MKKSDIKYLKDTIINNCKLSYSYASLCPMYANDKILIGDGVYLSYVSYNENDNDITFHILFNEKECDLNGNQFDFTFIQFSRNLKEIYICNHDNNFNVELYSDNIIEGVVLYPNWDEIIINTFKSYPKDEFLSWVKKTTECTEYRRTKNHKNILTWEERIESCKNDILSDRLVNNHKTPYACNTLNDMLTMGEVKFNEQQERFNKIMSDIWKEIE